MPSYKYLQDKWYNTFISYNIFVAKILYYSIK